MSSIAALAATAPRAAQQAAGHFDIWPTIVLVGGLLAMIAFSFWWLRGHDDPGEGWGRDDGPGGPPPDPPPSDGPAWWPEFEREFAAYVAVSGRSRSPARSAG